MIVRPLRRGDWVEFFGHTPGCYDENGDFAHCGGGRSSRTLLGQKFLVHSVINGIANCKGGHGFYLSHVKRYRPSWRSIVE